MCDYSLEHLGSRPAVAADRLTTTRFPTTATRGFTSIEDPNTAVCLRSGTELVFDTPPYYDRAWVFWPKRASSAVARFRQVDLDEPHTHHDTLEFSDGTMVPLSRLRPGQRATVLQLPSSGIERKNAVAMTELKAEEAGYEN